MPKPADCTTMAQIRAEIDRLDEDLVRLFAERAGYIDRAAEIKARRTCRRGSRRASRKWWEMSAAMPTPTGCRPNWWKSCGGG
jgi:hypothetical protein